MQPVLQASLSTSADAQRRQVQIALNPRMMGPYLAAVFDAPHAGQPHGAPLACRILDVKYEPGEYCSVFYQLGNRLVIGLLRWNRAVDEMPATAHLIEQLGMQVYRFEEDPALPGLAVAMDSRGMAAALDERLPECRSGVARMLRCQARPLRYRPGRRCTLRFDLWLRDTRSGKPFRRTLFGKVYHDLAKATSVYREMQMIADSMPARDGRLVVAHVAAFLPDLKLILQEPVEGTPLELLLEGMRGAITAGDRRGWDGVIRSAAALAALHTAGLSTDRERPIAAELRRFVKRATQATEVDALIGGRMRDLASALPAWLPRLAEWGETMTLVHGDCKHSQCLVTSKGIAILDFDHCGMADPATDIGTYMATLRQMGIHQALNARNAAAAAARARWLRTLEEQFLTAYCDASGFGPAFRMRAAWYEAVALMRKALRGFARSPRSPMPTAQVEEAWRILATLPPAG